MSVDEIAQRNWCEMHYMNELYEEAQKSFVGLTTPIGRREFFGVHYPIMYAEHFARYWRGEGHKKRYDPIEHSNFMHQHYITQGQVLNLSAALQGLNH